MHSRGFGLVEVIIGAAIIAMVTIGAAAAIGYYIKTGLAQTERIQAAYLLEEGLEAMRFLRDFGYEEYLEPLALDTPYHLATTTLGWEATTTPVSLGGFTRTVTLEEVWRRDSDKDIVPSTSGDPKTVDPDARKITVEVSWQTQSTTEVISAATYLANIFVE